MSIPIDKRNKKIIMNQNALQSRSMYKVCIPPRAIKYNYYNNYNTGQANNICNVYVINSYSVDVVSEFCNKGYGSGYKDNYVPSVMCTVGERFMGSNLLDSEDVRDEMFNLRTNFNVSVMQHNPYPIKDSECVFNRFITCIRNNNLQFLSMQQIYIFAGIVTPTIHKPRLLDKEKMMTKDFTKVLSTIESVFQVAHDNRCNLLILTPFGHNEDDIPQEDIVKIYNSCIYKYGHLFKYIIISIAPWEDKQLFELFDKNIIKPQEITKEIDEIYVRKEYSKKKKTEETQQMEPHTNQQMNPLMNQQVNPMMNPMMNQQMNPMMMSGIYN